MQDITHVFIKLLMFAIVRFYQIDYNKLNLYQKNYLKEKVKSIVLGFKVSKILHQAALEVHRDEIMDFSKAMAFQYNRDLESFQLPPQYHLDEAYYKKETTKEKEIPIKVLQTSMEKTAFNFRL